MESTTPLTINQQSLQYQANFSMINFPSSKKFDLQSFQFSATVSDSVNSSSTKRCTQHQDSKWKVTKTTPMDTGTDSFDAERADFLPRHRDRPARHVLLVSGDRGPDGR